MPKLLDNWKIVPSSDNTVSAIGVVDGKSIQTSPICFGRAGEIKTENSHYKLGAKLPGIWEMQLEMRRAKQASNLKKLGIL